MNIDYRAATLAVGTELTDGQVLDRNSAWLSRKLAAAGLEVIEHRAVADDRKTISVALGEITRKVSHLFVTGGLGPTSDDFTREVLADYFGRPLKFDEASWQRIVERFRARGQEARPIQRQQCFFPEGAEILENPAGTANAFRFQVQRHGRPALHVYVMPGPPVEIDAVWKLHYINVVDGIVPLSLREELHIFRTLGPGESTIAEIVEPLIQGHGVRVGYRAHLPYVEVKLWIKRGYSANEVLASIQRELGTSLVATGDEDLADAMISVFAGQTVAIRDGVTRGEFEARLRERLPQEFSGAVSVETAFGSVATAPVEPVVSVGLRFELHERQNKGEFWSVTVKNSSGVVCELEVQPTPLYKFGTERGRKYFTEKVFHLFKTEVLPKLTK